MDEWQGFTPHELNRIKNTSEPNSRKINGNIKQAQMKNVPTKKKVPSNKSAGVIEPVSDDQLLSPKQNNSKPNSSSQIKSSQLDIRSISENKSIESNLTPNSPSQKKSVLENKTIIVENRSNENNLSVNTSSQKESSQSEVCISDENKSKDIKLEEKKELAITLNYENKCDDDKITENIDNTSNDGNNNHKIEVKKEVSNVVQFQLQQKLIEDQNKKKKGLLTDAIFHRQKKAQQEAIRLKSIQKELGQLDAILHADVSVLRDKIEQASIDFSESQKRYERAEKEYIASKIIYHQTSEIKEKLTEHLYSIIHQNEVRKAKKLTELMGKLDMENEDENINAQVEFSCPSSLNPQVKTFCHSSTLYTKIQENQNNTSENDQIVSSKVLNDKNIESENTIVSISSSDEISDIKAEQSLQSIPITENSTAKMEIITRD